MAEDFAKNGRNAIVRVREDDPSTYLRIVAALMPKDVNLHAPTDIEPAAIFDQLRELVGRASERTLPAIPVFEGPPRPGKSH